MQRQWTKHIEIHMHYIRYLVHERIIDMQFCPSSKKTVDIFTKTFTEQKFHSLHDRLGVKDTIAEQLSFSSFDTLYFEGGGGVVSHEVFPLTWPLLLGPILHYPIVVFRGVLEILHTPRIFFLIFLCLLVRIEGLLIFKNLSYTLGEYSLQFKASYT